MKRIWIAVGIAALFGFLYFAAGAGRSGFQEGGSGAPAAGGRWRAPDFEVMDLNGNLLQLSALRGRVVLLDFWATWCPPCVAEIPHFRELYANYKHQGFEIIGFSLDEGGEKVVRSFVKEHEIGYPIAMGNHDIAQAYGGIHGLPTTLLIDKKGNVAKKYVGYHDKKEFEQEIQKLLSE